MNQHRFALLVLLLAGLSPRTARGQHEEQVADALRRIWRSKVEVVEPRVFAKKGALELGVGIGVIPTDPLWVYVPLKARLAYHLTEAWALGVDFAFNLHIATRLHDNIESTPPDRWQGERQRLRAALFAIWSPFYGKLAAGRGIHGFEPYFSAGVGIVATGEAPAVEVAAGVRPEVRLGAGVRLAVTRSFVLHLELGQHLYVRPEGEGDAAGGLAWPLEVALGGSLLLGGG